MPSWRLSTSPPASVRTASPGSPIALRCEQPRFAWHQPPPCMLCLRPQHTTHLPVPASSCKAHAVGWLISGSRRLSPGCCAAAVVQRPAVPVSGQPLHRWACGIVGGGGRVKGWRWCVGGLLPPAPESLGREQLGSARRHAHVGACKRWGESAGFGEQSGSIARLQAHQGSGGADKGERYVQTDRGGIGGAIARWRGAWGGGAAGPHTSAPTTLGSGRQRARQGAWRRAAKARSPLPMLSRPPGKLFQWCQLGDGECSGGGAGSPSNLRLPWRDGRAAAPLTPQLEARRPAPRHQRSVRRLQHVAALCFLSGCTTCSLAAALRTSPCRQPPRRHQRATPPPAGAATSGRFSARADR